MTAHHLFTYGSLMFDAVWSRVVCGQYRHIEAVMSGYRRYRVHNENYPALIPGNALDVVSGRLYVDISAADLAALDAFEGDYYQRIPIRCVDADGSTVTAETYVFREQYRALLLDEDWDPQGFARAGLVEFLRDYGRFTAR